ncbi:MAG: patatin-like phospholipase family protein [Bdellovibrionaceae bacterium]|nr:patatin-like phospholipase family protein [Pseudobdellovibrionaceae bacterium]
MAIKKTALVLSGGGSRGAYQAGVLKAFSHICHDCKSTLPMDIVTGASAGAINASFIASQIQDERKAADNLCNLWSNLKTEEVFEMRTFSLTKRALKLARGVSLGGLDEKLRSGPFSLLDTTPLRNLLSRSIDFNQINKNIKSQKINALAITATDYSTSKGVTFVHCKDSQTMWTGAQRLSLTAEITIDHVMGSSAIPFFFVPTKIDNKFYGDGCLRNTAPLSPAIHLGADKLFVVGVRNESDYEGKLIEPTLARLLSVVTNAVFLDAIDSDLERLELFNKSRIKKMRPIDSFYLSPSKDLAQIAKEKMESLPTLLKFLIRGLGSDEESAELVSYLMFEREYTESLIELGYKDVLSQETQILEFFNK